MKKYITFFYGISLLAFVQSFAMASDCKVIEHNDATEVVCQGDYNAAPKNKVANSETELEVDRQNILDGVKLQSAYIAKTHDGFKSYIKKNPKISEVKELLSDIHEAIYKIDRSCQIIGDEELLKRRGDFVEAAKVKHCHDYKYLASPWVATLDVKIANYLVQNGDNQAAKDLYRRVIVTFVGSAYKSQVKEAEFGLEDLK